MRSVHHALCLLATIALSGAAHAAGLLTPSDRSLPPLRVTQHVVDVGIRDGIAITTVRQTFHNDTNRRLEATYVFPLPEEGDLTNFQMSFNGKMVEGSVLPKDEARRVYEAIVRQTRDPGLIEFIGRRLLQMRVFPIEPNADVDIQLQYQQVCGPISGMRQYHYPLRTPGTQGHAHGTVRFTVELDSSAPLKSIWSPTHKIDVVRDGERKAIASYEASEGSLDEDFRLLYATDDSDLGLSVVAHRPDPREPGHFVLMLTPKQLWPERERPSQDVVFVLDTSGSMASDEKLAQASEALKYCVGQLGEQDRFSVVRFSTGFDVLYDELRPVTRATQKAAQDWIDGFRAAGGTNIADALTAVMKLERDDDRPFVVVFLTDGQGNRQPDEILDAVRGAAGATGSVRIFPFGVGHDVNTVLLDRLAADFTGRPTYVLPGEDLELVLGDFFSTVSQPVLTDVTIRLPEILATERFPAVLGDLYHGQQLTLAGRFDRETVGPVTLRARRGDERVELEWPEVEFVHVPSADYVPPVWAGRKIAWIVDEIRRHGESDELVKEILELSQAYGIQTPYSSWFVNPEGIVVRDQLARAAGARLGRGRSGGTGGGGDRGGERLFSQRQLLERRGAVAESDRELPSATAARAAASPTAASGQAATELARRNAELRERTSADEGRLDRSLAWRLKIGGTWYNRIGACLVDERFDDETELSTVRFGSDAYFELVRRRDDLREVLSASPSVLVMLGEGRGVLVSMDKGIESIEELEPLLGA